MDSKRSFIRDFQSGGLSFSELCRRHDISRPTGYKWVSRYRKQGKDGLLELSRRPKASPAQSTDRIEQAVVSIRTSHPAWGGRKIRRVLENEQVRGPLPAPSTITNILRRHDLLGSGMREGSENVQRFERDEPNDLWQMDFKGWLRMDNSKRCHPLTVLDDHSRYNISLEACSREDYGTVRPHLIKAFRRYGLPRQILCDHGAPWGQGLNEYGYQKGTPRLEVWLMRLGVKVLHGRVRHPQTQGKEERFHRTLKAEVLSRESLWKDLSHCQQAFDQWQWVYNEKRPHEALDLSTPSSRYQPSVRTYPEKLASVESFYLDDDIISKVKNKGEITFKNHFFYVGNAYIGSPVALRPRETDVWDVYFCWNRIGTIDLNNTHKQKGRYHSIRTKL